MLRPERQVRARLAALLGLFAMAAAAAQAPANLDACVSAHLKTIDPAAGVGVASAYERHGMYWHMDGARSHQARELSTILRAAEDFGLEAEYDPAAKASRLEAFCRTASPELLADVSLSLEAWRFIAHLHSGRIEPRAAEFHIARPRLPPATEVLQELAAAGDMRAAIADYEPHSLYYAKLKEALLHYRLLASKPFITELPPLPRRTLDAGDAYAGAAALRRLLEATGDLDATDIGMRPGIIDASLSTGLRHFQQRHGLAADGRLGPRTFAELTTPLSQRVRQIELTLERWRWLPELRAPVVVINIPQFVAYALPRADAPGELLEVPIIVGQPWRRTPVFVDEIEAVVFRPYWNVPASIVRDELLPLIRSSPDYLEKHHFEIVQGPGDDALPVAATPRNLAALAAGKLRLRQRPGADNALGLLKFELPNAYNVYLHDTPAAELFQRSARAFSHGCIRVSDPSRLAQYVLQDTPGNWDTAAIEAAMCGGVTRRITLKRRIPVMLLYGTALATHDGRVLFFDDIYGYDRRLEQLLERRVR